MTRLLWTCIALFPVPAVFLLFLGPPETLETCTLITDCETYAR